MTLYTRALKYIDMNRVKELHEEKIKQKEINEKINEEVIVYSDSEFCNWREETDLKENDWTSISADSMPDTGNTEINNLKNKSKRKLSDIHQRRQT